MRLVAIFHSRGSFAAPHPAPAFVAIGNNNRCELGGLVVRPNNPAPSYEFELLTKANPSPGGQEAAGGTVPTMTAPTLFLHFKVVRRRRSYIPFYVVVAVQNATFFTPPPPPSCPYKYSVLVGFCKGKYVVSSAARVAQRPKRPTCRLWRQRRNLVCVSFRHYLFGLLNDWNVANPMAMPSPPGRKEAHHSRHGHKRAVW